MCNCKVFEVITAIVVAVFAFVGATGYSKWILVAAAALLLIHAMKCDSCGAPASGSSAPKAAASKKKRI